MSLKGYADTFPLIKAFKDPDHLVDLEHPWDRRDALRLIDVFDLDAIVLHREYLKQGTVERLQRLLVNTFPVEKIVDEGSLSVLWMRREQYGPSHWNATDYRWDFDPSEPSFILFNGWLPPERSGDFTFAWADGKASQLWVFFPQRRDVVLELRLFPFAVLGSPPQQMKIYVNERFFSAIDLEAGGWHSYVLRVPHTHLTTGLNAFRFVYRYASSPAKVLPGSTDLRSLAVAFDFIAFRPE
jgi:hypothetical protein